MGKDEFKIIMERYECTIQDNDGSVICRSKNNLNGRDVECVMEYGTSGSLNGWEKTCEILGGFGYQAGWDDDTLIRELCRYNWKKKRGNWEQIKLF